MRSAYVLIAASILLLILPLPLASAAETFNCHTWDTFAGDRETGVGVSDDTAVYVAAGGVYVISDGAPLVSPWLLNLWIYEETNGEFGLQRGDSFCDETNGGANGECDCTIIL